MMRTLRHAAAMVLAASLALVISGDAVLTQARPPVTVPGIDKPVVVFSGRITTDTTWTADRYWVLRGVVFVAAGGTLTIEPGTTVVVELATIGTLVIEQGGRLIADGRADAGELQDRRVVIASLHESETDVVGDGHRVEQRRELEHIADPPPQLR